MKLRMLVGTCVLGLAVQFHPPALAQPSGSATLIESSRETVNGRTMHKVSFTYSFPDRNSIYITGVGQVAPSGSLTFYTEASAIEFRESYDGITLHTIYLNQGSSLNMNSHGILIASIASNAFLPDHAAPMLDSKELIAQQENDTCTRTKFPEMECFNSGTRSETWKPPLEFAHQLNKLLNEEFPLGIKINDAGSAKGFITSFVPLDQTRLPWNLVAQIALYISYEDPGSRPNSARITYMIRPLITQRRRKESRWTDSNIDPRVTSLGAAYVTDFIKKLNGRSTE